MSHIEIKTNQHLEHKFLEYGRWFNGYGGDFGDHRHDDSTCMWRLVKTTTKIEYGDWTDTRPSLEEA